MLYSGDAVLVIYILRVMDAKLENAILRHLASGFEQDLFKAAIANVDDEKISFV